MALGNATQNQLTNIPNLYTKEIQDIYLRRNFENLVAYFSANNQLTGFNFFELILNSPVSSPTPLTHNLGYLPKDIVLTQMTGSGEIEFLFGKFTSTSIFYTATGPCRARFFVGTYLKDSSVVQAQSGDTQTLVPTPLQETSNISVSSTGSYMMTGSEYVVFVNTISQSGGVFAASVTLPPLISGTVARIQKTDANSNPVNVNVLNGTTTKILPLSAASLSLTTQGQTVSLFCDGSNWYIIDEYTP